MRGVVTEKHAIVSVPMHAQCILVQGQLGKKLCIAGRVSVGVEGEPGLFYCSAHGGVVCIDGDAERGVQGPRRDGHRVTRG